MFRWCNAFRKEIIAITGGPDLDPGPHDHSQAVTDRRPGTVPGCWCHGGRRDCGGALVGWMPANLKAPGPGSAAGYSEQPQEKWRKLPRRRTAAVRVITNTAARIMIISEQGHLLCKAPGSLPSTLPC